MAQAVAKLKSHARLNALRAELEELESKHRDGMRGEYERQIELCRQLDLPEPGLPSALREIEQTEVEEPPESWMRRLLKRRKRTVADGSPHSRFMIIGRHGGNFLAGVIWRVWSRPILNLIRPLLSVLRPWIARILTFAPRLAGLGGGAGGSIAASTGLRFALGAFNIIGIIIGPVLAAWAIYQEIRNVRKAHSELESTRIERKEELYRYTARTRQLERQLAATNSSVDAAVY